jgi:hypothetical protein
VTRDCESTQDSGGGTSRWPKPPAQFELNKVRSRRGSWRRAAQQSTWESFDFTRRQLHMQSRKAPNAREEGCTGRAGARQGGNQYVAAAHVVLSFGFVLPWHDHSACPDLAGFWATQSWAYERAQRPRRRSRLLLSSVCLGPAASRWRLVCLSAVLLFVCSISRLCPWHLSIRLPWKKW